MILKLKDSNLDLENVREISRHSKIKLEKLREGLKIPIISDSMFHTLFQREECIQFPCKLLSYIVDLSYEELLSCLTFSKTETGKEARGDYEYRSDLVVNIKGTKVIVEMNNNDNPHIRERNISYIMRTREDREEKDEYHQTILVNLNNYCYEKDDKVRRDIALFDQDGNLYTNTLVIVDIYLPNIKKKCYTKGIKALSEMERFLLIGIEQDIKSADQYIGEDIVMEEFMKESERRSYDDSLRESYNKEEALKEQAFREGREEIQVEVLKRMLMEKASIDLIEKYTNMTKEKIKKLAREENLNIDDSLDQSYNKKEALKEQAFREGREEGHEEGRTEKEVEVAKKMLEHGECYEKIMMYTSLSEKELEKIKETL